MRILCSLGVFLLVFGSCAADTSAAPSPVERYTLDNGLDVILRPVSAGDRVALCVVFDVGEDHDPEGKSGLAHLVEHCYVTCAAGDAPARSAVDMMRDYPQAWNAQTGAQYTVIAFVFPKARLDAELKDAAARMGALRITDADLERETPRMLHELHNMFDGIPMLVARNRARELVRPSPTGGRKGGEPAQVRALTTEDATLWHARHYKPVNATLVLAGRFDTEDARALVARHFSGVTKGEALGPPRAIPEARTGDVTRFTLSDDYPGVPEQLCRAYVAPAPGSPHHPAFLILVTRMLAAAQRRHATPYEPAAGYAVLDDPDVLYLTTGCPRDKSVDEVVSTLDEWIASQSKAPPLPAERAHACQMFGFALGTCPIPDIALANNPYGLAFGLARRDQFGVESTALAEAIDAVDEAAWTAMVEAVLAPARAATVAAVRADRAN